LVEAYDLDESIGITLTNVSTRSFVDTDQNVMIGGFISGDVIVRVIVRALGPILSAFGAPNVLADPTLKLRDLDGTLIDSVYQHVLAWREALEGIGQSLAVWRIHRRVGMSGGLLAQGVDIIGSSPPQFSAYLKGETAKWAKVIKDANVRPE